MKVNEILKSSREQKKISLQSIHQATKISLSYLQALESGQWDLFPAEVYLLGFMKKYSSYLGLDPKEILLLYKKEVEAMEKEKREQEDNKGDLEERRENHPFISHLSLFLLLVVLGGWWLYTMISSIPTSKKDKTDSPGLENKLSDLSFIQSEPLLLKVQATDMVWVRIAADKKLSYEGFLSSGTSRSYTAKDEVMIRLKSPENLRLSLNGFSIDPHAEIKKGVNEIILTHRSIDEQSILVPKEY